MKTEGDQTPRGEVLTKAPSSPATLVCLTNGTRGVLRVRACQDGMSWEEQAVAPGQTWCVPCLPVMGAPLLMLSFPTHLDDEAPDEEGARQVMVLPPVAPQMHSVYPAVLRYLFEGAPDGGVTLERF